MLRETEYADLMPQPWDVVTLRPGNTSGWNDPAQRFVIADYIEPDFTRHDLDDRDYWEIYLPRDHPQFPDWAATISDSDIHQITRLTPLGERTWTIPQPPETDR